MRVASLLAFALVVLLTACAPESEAPTSGATPDLEATVRAVVNEALPTATPTPTPDIDATVVARMAATASAIPSPTPTPAPTATPTPTPLPTPTHTPTPLPTPTLTPVPIPTPTESAELRVSAMVNDVRPAVVRISSTGGTGTGVIYDTEGQTAYIITNQHVVEGQALVNVTVRDSATYEGTVLGVNDVRDLAVVRICCGSFQSLTFGDVDSLEAGTEIVAIGYALDIEGPATVTKGIVSAVRFNRSYGAQVIQTDAPINPGNSGGPLLSLDGKVLGINTFKLVETDVEGVGFAISALSVQESLPALRVGTPPPTPTADLRLLTPTPRPSGAETWGPLSGELEHDPTDGFIKTDYARVSFSDMVVEATFTNPYPTSTGSWDYGFILRQNRDDPFLQFIVSSDERWAVSTGTNAPYDRLGGGTIDGLDTSDSGRNHVMVVVIGSAAGSS